MGHPGRLLCCCSGTPGLCRRRGLPSPSQQESPLRNVHVQIFLSCVKNHRGGNIFLVFFTFLSCWTCSISDCFSKSFLAGSAWTPRTAWRAGDKRRYRTTWKGSKAIPKGAVERGWTWDIAMPIEERTVVFFCLTVCKA